MGEFEAIGDVVSGAALARSVEPNTGGLSSDGHSDETACLNCGTPLAGDYCHACGQHRHVHRTLTAFFHDLLHGVLHFEGKVWGTLPLLAWKPGELTRRYVEGQRARFVSPIALFLFSVFLMFAVVNMTGSIGELPEGARQGIQEELRVNREKLARLEAQRSAAAKADQPVARLDERIANLKEEVRTMEAVRSGNLNGAGVQSTRSRRVDKFNRASRTPGNASIALSIFLMHAAQLAPSTINSSRSTPSLECCTKAAASPAGSSAGGVRPEGQPRASKVVVAMSDPLRNRDFDVPHPSP